MEKAYKEEDIEKLNNYQSSDFVHPHLKWINFLSKRLGDESFFKGVVKIEGHNVYHHSGDAVEKPYWHASGGINWGWRDDNGFDSGYNSGVQALDAIKSWVRDASARGDIRAKLFIGEWEANFGKW